MFKKLIGKILGVLVLVILQIHNVLGYTATNRDDEILEKLYIKIDILEEKSPESLVVLKEKIYTIIQTLDTQTRSYYLLKSVSDYLAEITIKEESSSPENIFVIVNEVIDGDTFSFLLNGKMIKSRMIGIDSPENTALRYGHTESFAKDSTAFLKEKIEGKTVMLEYDASQGKFDQYDRHLVFIFLDGENINNTMIVEGYAKEYTFDKEYKYSELFKQSEKDAKQKKIGMWKEAMQKKTTTTQNNDVEEIQPGECNIKGNINSKKVKIYHLLGCRDYKRTKISPSKGEKYFCTQEEAKNAGWRIAQNC